ncbi:hypothetical protein QNE95_004165 [Vibrio vulnificus]|uniref:hypothetical protein n=1 Tax=Vibrio vulnificus TaxID=672 RepID=UPI001A1B3913|nr:hypothetical protein [Vibrio vulnificus]EKO5201054.1 hypothetical protein [Vibrio vulnificus]ELV8600935.1 hypothetical protein [Vibrio vulnificus]ELV8719620.1 hypothetical protein [Vibrio vulnificus]MDS1833322.1 hypothetical protein [Vibrio vulnificus]HAS8349103.1 hypothetical protein [Vibrio vulnificus]
MTDNNKRFTKREWITLIILLGVIQAFFWYAVFENSQSASALAYVSFAGTLVSIILAVLAIGYTYGESISQKNKSDGLTEQIKTLGKLIESVEMEAKSLENIQEISKELSNFIGVYRDDKKASDNHFNTIQKTIASLTKTDNSIVVKHEGKLPPFETVFKRRSPLDTLCYLMLVYLESNQINGLNDFGPLDDVLTETPMGLSPSFFHGAFYTQSSLLINLGYIKSENEFEFSLDEDFKSYVVNELVDNTKLPPQSSYGAIIAKVHKLVKETAS